MSVIEKPNTSEVNLDEINAALANNAENDPLSLARERMAERRRAFGGKVKRVLSKTALFFCLFVGLILLGGAGGGYYIYSQGDFYSSRSVDEKQCRIKIGDNDWYLMGRRYYTYRYLEILGFRFIDTSGISERTELFVDTNDMMITWTTKEGEFGHEYWPAAEPGVFPMPDAERYTIFSGKVVGSVTYQDFCKGFNKQHPFATE